MSDEKDKKVTDEELEKVSGGTHREELHEHGPQGIDPEFKGRGGGGIGGGTGHEGQ